MVKFLSLSLFICISTCPFEVKGHFVSNCKILSYAYVSLIPDSRYAKLENKVKEIYGMWHRMCRGEMNRWIIIHEQLLQTVFNGGAQQLVSTISFNLLDLYSPSSPQKYRLHRTLMEKVIFLSYIGRKGEVF